MGPIDDEVTDTGTLIMAANQQKPSKRGSQKTSQEAGSCFVPDVQPTQPASSGRVHGIDLVQRHWRSWMIITLVCFALSVTVITAVGGKLDRPVAMYIRNIDGERFGGKITEFDDIEFTMELRDESERTFRWDELAPLEINRVYRKVAPKKDAQAMLDLGIILAALDSPKARATELALKQAEKYDPDLKDETAAVRKGEVPWRGHEPEADTNSDNAEGDDELGFPDEQGIAANQGPRTAGEEQHEFWGELSDEVMASSVEELKAFANEAKQKLNIDLKLYETDYFLFYSDLHPKEAERWAGLLDKMYGRLAELFGVDDGVNIFRGKCLIVVFRKEMDYLRYESVMHGINAAGSAGICWSFGNGYVHISFYRQANEWLFAHILVHESVHGFVHRFESPVFIPSWVNEGLAELIATNLVPQANVREQRLDIAEKYMRYMGGYGGMFTARHINAYQYGVALSLTEFMVNQSKPRYADFVRGIKDGLSWHESLKERYGVPIERLMEAHGRTMRLRDLSP